MKVWVVYKDRGEGGAFGLLGVFTNEGRMEIATAQPGTYSIVEMDADKIYAADANTTATLRRVLGVNDAPTLTRQ